jgi:hypothetical protein
MSSPTTERPLLKSCTPEPPRNPSLNGPACWASAMPLFLLGFLTKSGGSNDVFVS